MKIKPTCYYSTEAVVWSCYVKKDVLTNSAKFTEKDQCQSLFFNKVAGILQLYYIRLWYSCFPINFVRFLRTPILKNRSNGRDWKKMSEANLACLLSIQVSGFSLKVFSEEQYLKPVKHCHHQKTTI